MACGFQKVAVMATLSAVSSTIAVHFTGVESFSGRTYVALGASTAACIFVEGLYRIIGRVAQALQQKRLQDEGLRDELFSLISKKCEDESLLIRRALKLSLPPKRPLILLELSPNFDTCATINSLAWGWQRISLEKRLSCVVSLSEKKIFFDLSKIAKSVARLMEHPREFAAFWLGRIVVCKDAHLGEIQAIAFVHLGNGQLKVTHLMTHPQNVRSSVNEMETTRVEGAGSAIIHHLAATMPPSCQEIYLHSFKSALPFYRKLGFEEVESPFHHLSIPMRLSAQKIQQLLEKAA